MIVLFGALCVFSAQQSGAAETSSVVSFFRTQQSLFPSGQASRSQLESQVVRRDLEPWLRISWNLKEFEVPGDAVVKDLQTSQTLIAKESVELCKEPQPNSEKVTFLPAKTRFVVLRTTAYWAELLEPEKKITGWAPLHLFSVPVDDRGIFVALMDTPLKKSAKDNSETLAAIPRLQRLTPIGYEKNYLKVKMQNLVGYVDANAVAGRADFANWAYHRKKGWISISHRENADLITSRKQVLPLKDFTAFSPYLARGIVCQKLSDGGPSIRSRVDVLTNKAHLWTLSQLEGHGPVWWRMDEPESAHTPPPPEKTWSNQDLLQRQLTGVAFVSNKIPKGLASARGIFRTDNGKTWIQIPMFGDKDYPIAIHPDGAWYVGSYRSFDQGKTFEPYIRWDKITEQIENKLHKAPKQLRIAQIEPLPHSLIRILVDTGSQKLKMQSHILSHEWTLVK